MITLLVTQIFTQVRNFRTWEEEFSIVSDHRILSVEVGGRLGRNEERKREKKRKKKKQKEKKRGWKRAIKNKELLQESCEEEMRRWREEFGEGKQYNSEQVWMSWLETHNKTMVGDIKRGKRESG